MVRHAGAALVLVFCLGAACSPASTDGVSVASFRDLADGAVSFTFDDGNISQKSALQYLSKFDFKATFAIIVGGTRDRVSDPMIPMPHMIGPTPFPVMSWEEWKEIADQGHEIAVHSMTHRSLIGLGAEELHLEIVVAKEVFTEKMGFSPMTFAYPYDRWNAVVQKLVLENYAIDRSDQSGAAGFLEAWGGKEARGPNTTGQMNLLAEAAVKDGTWRVAEMHGIDDLAWGSTSGRALRSHLAHCRELVDAGKLWVDTYANVGRYIRERDAVSLEVVTSTINEISFRATYELDDEIYDVPLTFVLTPGMANPQKLSARREGSDAPLEVRLKHGKILVDALPGPAAITVTWAVGDISQRPH